MVLDTRVSYPHTRMYLLKLHVDAVPGMVFGRLEHIASGQEAQFATLEELGACLSQVSMASGEAMAALKRS